VEAPLPPPPDYAVAQYLRRIVVGAKVWRHVDEYYAVTAPFCYARLRYILPRKPAARRRARRSAPRLTTEARTIIDA